MRDVRASIPPTLPTHEATKGLRWRSTDLAHHFISLPSTFYLFPAEIEHSVWSKIHALAIIGLPPTHQPAPTAKVFAPRLATNRP